MECFMKYAGVSLTRHENPEEARRPGLKKAAMLRIKKGPAKILLPPLIAAIAFSCASTRITSNADQTYARAVNKLYILAQLPDKGWGSPQWLPFYPLSNEGYQENAKLFKTTIENRFQKIGVLCSCYVKTGTELDEGAYLKTMQSFDPDAVLVINFTSAVTKNGVLASTDFNLSFIDFETSKQFWRAALTVKMKSAFGGPQPSGDNLANDMFEAVVKQLKLDKLQIFATIEPQ